MELDVLYDHIASPTVVADFSALARRIANKELVHGADIIVGIHTRLLKGPHPNAVPLPRHSWWHAEPTKEDLSMRDVPEVEVEARSSHVGMKCGLKKAPHPWGSQGISKGQAHEPSEGKASSNGWGNGVSKEPASLAPYDEREEPIGGVY